MSSPEPWRSPDLALVRDLPEMLHPAIRLAPDSPSLFAQVKPAGDGLWLVPVLSHEACRRLRLVINSRLAWKRHHPGANHSPNAMHYGGVIVEPTGLVPAISALRETIVGLLQPHLFPEFHPIDEDYAFVATYGQSLDQSLGFHADDSEITLNIAISSGHSGGQVLFQGRRCPIHRQEPHRAEEEFAIAIPEGFGLLHAGSHRHLVTRVYGERQNLIVWCRSSDERSTASYGDCAHWCGHQGR